MSQSASRDSSADNPETRRLPSTPDAGAEPVLDPLAEAEALRALLQEAQVRLGRLLAALKHERRQTRALRAAMASLQHLRLGP